MAGMTSQWMRHCFHHLLHSLWRKKPLLLAIIMVSTLVVVAFQYHSVSIHGGKSGSERLGSGANDLNQEKGHRSLMPRRNLSALSGQVSRGLRNGEMSANKVDAAASQGQDSFAKQPLARAQYVNNDNSQQQYGIFDAQKPAVAGVGHKFISQQPQGQGGEGRLRNGGLNEQDTGYEQNGLRGKQVVPKKEYYIPPLRLVHLDLKGAPPKISYFKQIFPLLKEAGANGILLEYEDMFPFWGILKPIASPSAYSKDDLKAILDLAKLHNFEIIPLVQTFGHLEFALKLSDFRELREVDSFPMALCPSRNDSFNLVTQIIDQVVIMHPTIKWLHVGCDEVFHLGYCDKCRQKDRDSLYLNHVARVARYVRDQHNIIPIIWDDMLRNIPTDRLKEMKLGTLVEPMIWTYVREVYRFIPYSTWMSFAEVFPNIWAASAFKGAFGETLTVPNVKMHLENNEAWLEVMSEQHKNFKSFRGIAVTGWQRYDHLAVLCELLPSGLPSLVVNLLTLNEGHFDSTDIFKRFDRIMGCTTPRNYYSMGQQNEVDLEADPYLWQRASSCFFPGSPVFRLTQHVSEAVKRVNDFIYDVTVHKAWMTEYNVRHNLSNPFRVDEGLQDHSTVYYSLTSLVRTAEDALKEVFDHYTVSEWIEQNIYPYLMKMEKLMKDGVDLKKPRTWARRPLPPLEDLKRFGVGTGNGKKR